MNCNTFYFSQFTHFGGVLFVTEVMVAVGDENLTFHKRLQFAWSSVVVNIKPLFTEI